jgi:23S rRNA pseudouridine955/2504/2580 synthase
MTGVQTVSVQPEDAGLRLDHWFKRHFPGVPHGRLEKLLRTGQVRVDGKRVKSGERLEAWSAIRVPPLGPDAVAARPAATTRPVDAAEAERLQRRVLYRDDWLLAIDKPSGLAVQGGTKQSEHLDGMLDALRFDAPERPRLVHRLDQDTSGVLLLARSRAAAQRLTEAFRDKAARKTYWAIVVGLPALLNGRIDLALSKGLGKGGERVRPVEDKDDGRDAVTLYRTVDAASRRAAWLELRPLTGRTHQLRAHCAFLGTPILGDGKYGGAKAYLASEVIERRLHLHARSIVMPHPAKGMLRIAAPLPPHMARTWRELGFEANDAGDPFADAFPQPRPR